jgi:serine phosphatase RsbU (regulator of sigma subunit)/pSer/pThr/pTyr-binding forkhead associated (FHA) protein
MTLFLSGTVGAEFRIWPLDAPSTTVGRSSRNAIHVGDATVSKEHAEITRRADRAFIRDLGSRNGTRVNGTDVRGTVELKPEDMVEIGHVTFRITRDEPTQRVRLNEGAVLGSSVRIRVDKVLQRQGDSTPGRSGRLVQVLAEAGRLLVLPRPLKETCDELLKFVERAIPASRYILLIQEAPGREPVQIAARTKGAGANEPLALSQSIVSTVMQENTSVLTSDAANDPRFQGHQSIVAQAVQSAMAVPLFDDEKVLGILYVDSRSVLQAFDEQQLEVLTLLANMAAVKITNARLLEAEQARARLAHELATATRIQRGLLPLAPPQVPGYQIDGFLETCYEVGGDLYDFRVKPDGRLMFVVGDVSGKGMGAALLMSSFLSSARVLYDTCDDPAVFAARLSAVMSSQTEPGHFITGVVGCLEPESGTVHYVNAGHGAMYLVRNGRVEEFESTGVPFGVTVDVPYRAAKLELAPGTIMAIFSDGIPEAQRGEEFFEEARVRLALIEGSAATSIADVRAGVIAAVDAFLAGAHRSDDMTLVMIRRDA